MLRGAIDLVQEDRISGWFYSDVGNVSDRLVLAFLDEQCVGSGRINLMREDLKEAGLGDGKLGFEFTLSLKNHEDLPRVIVKLDGSDLFLIQQRAKIEKTELFQPIFTTPARIDWMRSKGVITPGEEAFLKYIQQLSAFDYSLIQVKTLNSQPSDLIDPLTIAKNMFDLLLVRKANVKELSISIRYTEELRLAVLSSGTLLLPIIAITSQEPGAILIVEGTHKGIAASGEGFNGAIEYRFGPDRLLFLDLNARFRFDDKKAVNFRIFAAS